MKYSLLKNPENLTANQQATLELMIKSDKKLYRLTNARIEAINNKIKVTIRMGYGFRNIDNLIALVRLKCSDKKVNLPGRTTNT